MVTIQQSLVSQPNLPIEHVKSVTLFKEVALPYVEQVDPSALRVVLLHGFTDSCCFWEPVLHYLPHSIRAFALMQPGIATQTVPRAPIAFKILPPM